MHKIIAIGLLALAAPLSGMAENWNLPTGLGDENLTVKFEVDSTWHLVEGSTKGVSGRAWLEGGTGLDAVRAEVTLPVAQFETGSRSRDSKMRKVMHADRFPNVHFKAQRVNSSCPDPMTSDPCPIELAGEISISGVTAPVTFPATIVKDGRVFTISGAQSLRWEEFGIEDPSILVAKLDPQVKILFVLKLLPPDQRAGQEGES